MNVISFVMISGVLLLGTWFVRRCLDAICTAQRCSASREAEFLERAVASMSPRVLESGSGGAPEPRGEALSELLSREERVVYALLKTAVPEYEVLVQVDSRKLLRSLDYGTFQNLDFVVCSKDFRPVAVVILDRPDDPFVTSRSRGLANLASVGVKLAHWRVEQLPDRTAVRGWMLDCSVPGERRFAA